MNHSFLTKYTPHTIEDFHYDVHTENALKTFIEMDDLNLLLYGTSNCGKTMLLECLVRTYYGLSKKEPLPENNIIYINNLKEQGIQYYRNEMKTFCQTKSIIHGKKKMIVIDDIDNVNEQSQQVFRTYFDHYKHNVHFTMVCTNMQKVIESIQSRAHIIQLKPLSLTNIDKSMKTIIEEENMEIDEETRAYLLTICNQSIRIMMNHLEKLYILDEPITLALCKHICSNISFKHFEDYLNALRERELSKSIEILNNLYDSGYSVIDIFDYFFYFLKSFPELDETIKYRIIPYLCKYITIFHNLHEDKIELALFTNSMYQDIMPM
jgi:DNA polymerase III delta prime subunit